MRLSFAERQRRISKGLCFSCGGGGHVITTCPTRPPRLWVSAIRHPPQNMQPLTIYLRLYEVDSQQLHAKTYLILTCSETYLLFLLLVGSCVFLVCQRAAIDLGCVFLLVIHEFLARQVPSVYPLLSRQTTKSHTHHFSLLPQLLNQ